MRTDDPDRNPKPDPPVPTPGSSLDEFFRACYEEIRAIAHRRLQTDRARNALQTTDLVHDVYERLKKSRSLTLNDRVHFIAITARTVRRHLCDRAREEKSERAGGGLQRVTLSTDVAGYEPFQPSVIALGRAMDALEKLHARQAWTIDMRFLGGLTVAEVADKLGVSDETVKNDTRVALAFLRREISRLNLD